MKKLFNYIIILCVFIMPIFVNAKGIDLSQYNVETLQDALTGEEIEADLDNYTSDNNPINIYLFRGAGCSHCYEFLEYASSDLVEKYGDKINFVIFETWQDSDNASLFSDVASFLGKDASGVPFIVIGDQTFEGYASSMNSEIESAIEELYDSDDRFDIATEFDPDTTATTDDSDSTEASTSAWSYIFTIVVAVVLFIFFNNKYKKLEEKVNSLDKKKSKN